MLNTNGTNMTNKTNNASNVIKPTDHQAMDGKLVPARQGNRQALSVVDENLVVNKSGISRKDVAGAENVLRQSSRPVTRKDAVGTDNVVHQASRPVTRRFAAQLKSSRQARLEECTKLKPTVPLVNESGENIRVDAESKVTLDHPVPMSLGLSDLEESPYEEDQMDEDEIENIDEEEAIIDIDGLDSKNPLAVPEYVDELYASYKKMEIRSCVSPDYMIQQYDINDKMRAILIDWLIEVHFKFELMDETLFLTVNIIDRFLAQHSVARKKLQLVGLAALLLACKYEEVSVPVVGDLIFISDNAYARQEILDMETLMLNTLQFYMTLPTPYVFIIRFLKAAQSDKKHKLLSFFLIELTLVEYEMLKYPPSLLAAAAVYTAHCTLYGFGKWTKTCEWHSSYSEDGLLECSKLMVGLHQKAARGKLTGVHRKYSTSKYGFIAKQGPALFLLETQP